jgi:hypothetical protein
MMLNMADLERIPIAKPKSFTFPIKCRENETSPSHKHINIARYGIMAFNFVGSICSSGKRQIKISGRCHQQ